VEDAEAGSRRRLSRAAAILAAVVIAGCGSNTNDEPGSSTTAKPTTRLVVNASGRPTMTIDCPGSALCARLDNTPASAFDPVPKDVACSQIYSGDQKATVRGTLSGKPIDASFSRQNGCETARWDKLDWLLGKPA
jgi:hypothetical protein